MCEPLIELNICDDSVKIAEGSGIYILRVVKSNTKVVIYEIEDDAGDILISNEMIIDFANTSHVFKVYLTQDNEIIPMIYFDCMNTQLEADKIRLKFTDVETEYQNTRLDEVC